VEIIVMEIPEFESNEFHKKFSFFKIYGMESEKPIVRMNEYIFEGKWFFSSSSPFYFTSKQFYEFGKKKFYLMNHRNNKNSPENRNLSKCQISKIQKSLLQKRLRLHRLPLFINQHSK